ncbi:MAG: hypothetical protein PHI96_01755 [Desulfovibrio sp.]|nr:hypothetical protein [Desulfovibrio sp.]
MKHIIRLFLALGLIWGTCLGGSSFAATPADHEKFWESNSSYKAMYDLYDLAQMNANNLLDEKDMQALEKKCDAAIAESVKKSMAAGKGEADAYAAAYGAQVLYINKLVTWAFTDNKPLAGFYLLSSDTLEGYLSITFEKDHDLYSLEFIVWDKADPGKTGKCYAQAKQMKEETVTSGVQEFTEASYTNNPGVQIKVAIKDGTATVTTTDAFNKGKYVASGVGEESVKSPLSIAGKYVLQKK